MRKLFAVILTGALLFAGGMLKSAHAADTFKVGIVDLIKALNESDPGKRAKADLESLIKSKQVTIDEKGKTIEKLKSDFEKQASIISGEAKKTKEAELERQVREYQRMVADSQAEIKKKESDLTGDILKELRDTINKVAQEEKFSLVIEQAEGLVLFNDKALDITDKIIQKYNESKKK